MPVKNIVLPAFLMLFASCNNEGKTSTEIKVDSSNQETTTKPISDALSSGCYSQIAGRDTASLQIENKDSSINGSLSYAIFQKDRNDGTLQAEITGDILKGWYLFKSEGIISVRQVAWKIKGKELWPGTGEVVEKSDTVVFSFPDKLQYDSTRPFKKVNCII
ncbi:MAG: hypothetical protein ABI675_08200 [Chitinophagaceae bacterium]